MKLPLAPLALASLALAGTLCAATVRYPTPIEVAVSPDGARLFVLCEGTDELVVADAHTGKIVGRVPVGHVPKGLWVGGQYAFVANSWSDTVSVIDISTLQVTRTLKTGFEPNAVFADAAGAMQPGNSHARARRVTRGRGAAALDRAYHLVPRNYRTLARRQFAFDHVQIGAAHATRMHPHR